MHTLLKPKFFIPVHGEYRHLKRHALLAEELGMSSSNIFIPAIGVCAEVTNESLTQGESFPAGARLIDGEGFEDLGTSEVLKDRIKLSSEGLFIISAVFSEGILIGEPVFEIRGVVTGVERESLRELHEVVKKTVESNAKLPAQELSGILKRTVKNFFFKKTRQSPMIIPIIQEI